jgi:hypothetical protein
VLLGIVTQLSAFAPSAFSGALLAEILRIVLVHFLGVLVHLENLIEGISMGLLSSHGGAHASLCFVSLEVMHVGVFLLQLSF